MKKQPSFKLMILLLALLISSACTTYQTGYSSNKKQENAALQKTPENAFDLDQYVYQNEAFVLLPLDKKATPIKGDKETTLAMYRGIKYPPIARENGVAGTCVIRVIVDETGLVENAFIYKDIGAGCGKAALKSIEAAFANGFEPAVLDGKPVKVRLDVPVVFSLG